MPNPGDVGRGQTGVLLARQGGTGIKSFKTGTLLIAVAPNVWRPLDPALTDGFILTFDSTSGLPNWEANAGGVPGPHTHDATDIVSGVLIDARVQQSNVTQHEAALSILFTQLVGVATRAQIPAEVAYRDEVNTFTMLNHFTDQIIADELEARARFSRR